MGIRSVSSICLLALIVSLPANLPAEATSTSCKTLWKSFQAGVARSTYSNSGLPLKAKPRISNSLYKKYRYLDFDADGIVCELGRHLNQLERLDSVVKLHDLEKAYFLETQTRADAQRIVKQLPMAISLDDQFGDRAGASQKRAQLEAAIGQVALSTQKMEQLDAAISALPTYNSPQTFSRTGMKSKTNCLKVRLKYPNGVADPMFYEAGLLQKGYPVVSSKIYETIRALDTDEDGIACESARLMTTREIVRKRTSTYRAEEARIYSIVNMAELQISVSEMERDYQLAVQFNDTESASEINERMSYARRWLNRQSWILFEFDHLIPELPRR